MVCSDDMAGPSFLGLRVLILESRREKEMASLVTSYGGQPVNAPSMREVPLDPWGRDYLYRYPGERGVDFDVYTVGPDGEDGTEDDVYNTSRRDASDRR